MTGYSKLSKDAKVQLKKIGLNGVLFNKYFDVLKWSGDRRSYNVWLASRMRIDNYGSNCKLDCSAANVEFIASCIAEANGLAYDKQEHKNRLLFLFQQAG